MGPPPVNPYLRKKSSAAGKSVLEQSKHAVSGVSSMVKAPVASSTVVGQVVSATRTCAQFQSSQPPKTTLPVSTALPTPISLARDNPKSSKQQPRAVGPAKVKPEPQIGATRSTTRPQQTSNAPRLESSSSSSSSVTLHKSRGGSFKSQLKQQIELIKRAKQAEKQRKIREHKEREQVKERERERVEYESNIRKFQQQQLLTSAGHLVRRVEAFSTASVPATAPSHPMTGYPAPYQYATMNLGGRPTSAMNPVPWTMTPAKPITVLSGVTPQQPLQPMNAACMYVTPSPLVHAPTEPPTPIVAAANKIDSPVAASSGSKHEYHKKDQTGQPSQDVNVTDPVRHDSNATSDLACVNTKIEADKGTNVTGTNASSALPLLHTLQRDVAPSVEIWGEEIPTFETMAPYNSSVPIVPHMAPHLYGASAFPLTYGTTTTNPLHGAVGSPPVMRGHEPNKDPLILPSKPEKSVPVQLRSGQSLIHPRPLDPRSPFAQTHEIIHGEIIVFKDRGGSFGITVECSTESVLVDREHLLAPAASSRVAPGTAPTSAAPSTIRQPEEATKQRKRRRVRVFFSAMMVSNATKQNNREDNIDASRQLRQGDIIITINGKSTGALSFKEACALFASCGEEGSIEQSVIQCPLLIARAKLIPPAPLTVRPATTPVPQTFLDGLPASIPFVVNDTTGSTVHGEFTTNETLSLANVAMKYLSRSERVLGLVASSFTEMECRKDPALARRSIETLNKKWDHETGRIELMMKQEARAHWKREWANEQSRKLGIKLPPGLDYITDSQRSAYRALPRPSTGCKCGSTEHEYVNDPDCPLYSNVRALNSNGFSEGDAPKPRPLAPKSLNAIETAFAERLLKLKDEAERVAREARFVEKMELLQVKSQKLAVFAPSFTAMVLSAVTECSEGEVPDEEVAKMPVPVIGTMPVQQMAMKDDDDSEEDDDVPLVALGKRRIESADEPQAKRSNTNSQKHFLFNPAFLAEVLRYISLAWGHVYTEASHRDHAWRWEVFHGQTDSTSGTNVHYSNPREPGRFSFETIRHAVTEDAIGTLATTSMEPKRAEALLMLTHLVSPQRTGLLDELIALTKSGMLRIDTRGYAVLRSDWTSKADNLLLNDMHYGWSSREDPTNKHYISEAIRDKLEDRWVRVDGGWALAHNREEIVHPDEEWEEWRRHFQSKHESQINEADGIGRFGI